MILFNIVLVLMCLAFVVIGPIMMLRYSPVEFLFWAASSWAMYALWSSGEPGVPIIFGFVLFFRLAYIFGSCAPSTTAVGGALLNGSRGRIRHAGHGRRRR